MIVGTLVSCCLLEEQGKIDGEDVIVCAHELQVQEEVGWRERWQGPSLGCQYLISARNYYYKIPAGITSILMYFPTM